MKLELRNVTHCAALSEETPAYHARLYVDGAFAAEVSNDGHGGCDMQHFKDRAVEERVTAHFKAMPEREAKGLVMDGKPFMVQPDLEEWCQHELHLQTFVKSVRRSKKLRGFSQDGKEWVFKVDAKSTRGHPVRSTIVAKYPGLRFADEMSDADLRAIAEAA